MDMRVRVHYTEHMLNPFSDLRSVRVFRREARERAITQLRDRFHYTLIYAEDKYGKEVCSKTVNQNT